MNNKQNLSSDKNEFTPDQKQGYPLGKFFRRFSSPQAAGHSANGNKNQTQEPETLISGYTILLKKREEEIELLKKTKIKLEQIKTDLEIKIQEKTKEFEILEKQLKEKTDDLGEKIKELKKSRMALMNVLEDAERARIKAEEEKSKTLAIITNFSDGLLVLDKENKLSLINPQAEIFFGVKSKEIINKPFLELTNSEFKPLMEFFEKKIPKTKTERFFRKELKIKENLILEMSVIPIINKEGKKENLIILHDITHKKLVERLKNEFVSLVAHQLRTPLSVIKWTLQMLLEGDLGEINKEQKKYIQKTYISNERMIFLINDLLNVARIEEGRFVYEPVLADLDSIINNVLDLYKENIAKKEIEIEFKKPKEKLPKIKVDVEKIILAIGNLLNNAIDYSYKGGKITISIRDNKKGEIEFLIKDNGIGIPKNQQERIFTKFFRAASAVKFETEGSGLGLFIAKNIIEAHQGRIWFESEEEKGTTFYFTLPVENKL